MNEKALRSFARLGYAARGTVYLIIAAFALLAAYGGSETRDSQGAISALLDRSFGEILVGIVILGLLGYAVWRFLQSLLDADSHGLGLKALVVRGGLLASGLIYVSLALFAAALLFGFDSLVSTGEGANREEGVAGALQAVFGAGYGRILTWGMAVVFAGVAVAHFVKGWRAGFEKWFDAPEDHMRWVRPISRVGLIARGIVFLIIAGLLVYGGTVYTVEKAPGTADALSAVQGWPFGTALLTALAIGLTAFAAYSFAESAYRRVGMDERQ